MSPSSTSPGPWSRGEVIADLYEVLDVIEGGLGLVYRVRHLGWGQELAIKRPRPELVVSEEHRRDFEAEAETWIGLGLHPHIVGCAYVLRLDGTPCVFAEWVEGGSLANWVRERTLYAGGVRVALQRVLDVAIQTAWGLAYAHQQDLVHQDIKPANLMLTPSGVAKVTDFGLARARAAIAEPCSSSAMTLMAGFGGMTRQYCSPEQFEAFEASKRQQPVPHLTRATDTWSWALSVLEMFIGSMPCVYGHTAGQALESFLAVGPADPWLPALPAGVADLLRRCFARDPDARPRRLNELAEELQDLHLALLGEPYARHRPEASSLLADGLSNQALSMLDLGRPESAEDLWQQALQVDPHHPHTVYNRGLYQWRDGQITDQRLVTDLERAPTDGPTVPYLLGLTHLERGDYMSAAERLEQAVRHAPGDLQSTAALEHVRDREQARVAEPLVLADPWSDDDTVRCFVVSPDGRMVLDGSDDGWVRCWDPATGARLLTLNPNSQPIMAAGRTSHRDVPDLAQSGQPHRLRSLPAIAHRVEALAVMMDGRYAVSSSRDDLLRWWDLRTGKLVAAIACAFTERIAVATTSNGLFAITLPCAFQDEYDPATLSSLEVWDLRTGRCLRRIGLEMPTFAMTATPDGRYALTAARQGPAQWWDLRDGRCLREIHGVGAAQSMAVTSDGRYALTCAARTGTQLWDLSTGQRMRALNGHQDQVVAVALSEDARYALTGGDDQTMRWWDLRTGRCLRTFTFQGRYVTSVAFTTDLRHAIATGPTTQQFALEQGRPAPWSYSRPHSAVDLSQRAADFRSKMDVACRLFEQGRLSEAADALREAQAVPGFGLHQETTGLWRMIGKGGRRTTLLNATNSRVFVADEPGADVGLHLTITADGTSALFVGPLRKLELWDLAAGRPLRQLPDQEAVLHHAVMTRDGRLAVATDGDRIRWWDLTTGQCQGSLHGHKKPVDMLAVTHDGSRVLSSSTDRTLRWWDLRRGACLRTIDVDTDWYAKIDITPDGRCAVAASKDVLQQWDLRTGRLQRSITTPDRLCAIALASDGQWALSGSFEGVVRWWDLPTGEVVHTLTGHKGWVQAVAISQDSCHALTAGTDATLRWWDLANGRLLATIAGQIGEIDSLSLSPDARFALIRGTDKTVRLWEFDWEYTHEAGPAFPPRPAVITDPATPRVPLRQSVLFRVIQRVFRRHRAIRPDVATPRGAEDE